MKPLQIARLLVVCSLSAAGTLFLTNCNQADSGQPPKPKPDPLAGNPLCSTISKILTDKCTITDQDGGGRILNYALTASSEKVTLKVANGREPALTVNDALVYNDSLTPERLELRRGDELRVNFQNLLQIPQRIVGQVLGIPPADGTQPAPSQELKMPPQFSNLHTHGLVTAWDFNNAPKPEEAGEKGASPNAKRGDNVLGILMNSRLQDIPSTIKKEDICMTTGDGTAYRYPIRADHDVGLNWYHPHPHGTSALQVSGGMSGLLMIADEKAEKHLNPVYLQLKDMQVSKLANSKPEDNTYQFEKFEPAVAGVCHRQALTPDPGDEGWAFDNDAAGRCNYHAEPTTTAPRTDYSWLFMVNGELLPDIKLPKQSYLRLINSSANATYRLALEPSAAQRQKTGKEIYYAPPFKVIEKDGTTTIEKPLAELKETCTLVMTPSTRVGIALDFKQVKETESVCKFTVEVTKGANNTQQRVVNVEYQQLTAAESKEQAPKLKFTTFNLVQEGINTGEDDWPAVNLATLIPDDKMPNADISAYQAALQEVAKAPVRVVERTEVKIPTDTCTPTIPIKDGDQIDRHLALFFGAKGLTEENKPKEHFGLVAAEEINQTASGTVKVDAALIKKWRDDYLTQFSEHFEDVQDTNAPSGALLREYDTPSLARDALDGLVAHKFRLEKDKPVHTNICTQTSNKPERWRIHNLSAQIHNFHLHQMKFQVANVRGSACMPPPPVDAPKRVNAFNLVGADGYIKANLQANDFVGKTDEQCVKTYAEMFHNIPATYKLVEEIQPPGTTGTASATAEKRAPIPVDFDYGVHDTFPVPPMGYIDIDVLFDKPEHVGEYVFHCHILEHEDAGMMGKIVVKPKASL